MRSRALCRGKISPRCVPGRQSVAIFSLHASQKGLRTGKSPLPGKIRTPCIRKRAGSGKICALCIRKAPQTAVRGYTARRSCQEGAPFAARAPRIMRGARILPSAAKQRERSQPRRRPYGAAACLGTAEQGAGGFLSGGVTLPKECVVLWGVERWRQSWHQ